METESLRIDNPTVVQLQLVDSTNAYLKGVEVEAGRAVVVIAGAQTAGRGQQGARWDSLPGDAMFSILLQPRGLSAGRPFLLSQLLALALCQAIGGLGVRAEVKWPNDILVNRKKVCGVLIETSLQGAYVRRAILGVGVNLAPRPGGFPAYPTPAATLADAVGSSALPSPATFVGSLIDAWNVWVANLYETGEEAVQRSYRTALFNGRGSHRFVDHGGEFRAEIAAMLPTGELVLRRADGSLRAYPFKGIRQRVE